MKVNVSLTVTAWGKYFVFNALICAVACMVAWSGFTGHVALSLFMTFVGVGLVQIREHMFPLQVIR